MNCTQSEIIDIGSGVTIEKRYIDERLAGVAYWHECPKGAHAGYAPIEGEHCATGAGWQLISEEPLTISPSLLCRACGHHGFIREGKWVSA
jgi:hypothetical protein